MRRVEAADHLNSADLHRREEDIGTGAGLFEVAKIGDEFYTFVVDCKVGDFQRRLSKPWMV